MRAAAAARDTILLLGGLIWSVWLPAAACDLVDLANKPGHSTHRRITETLLLLMLLCDILPAACGVEGHAHRLALSPTYLAFCTACTGLLHAKRFAAHTELRSVFSHSSDPDSGTSLHLMSRYGPKRTARHHEPSARCTRRPWLLTQRTRHRRKGCPDRQPSPRPDPNGQASDPQPRPAALAPTAKERIGSVEWNST
jgi:hypothetical protein